MLSKIRLCIETIQDVVVYFYKTGKLVDRKAMIEARVEACQSCTHCNKRYQQCQVCGCFIRIKARLIAADCPLRKWPTSPE